MDDSNRPIYIVPPEQKSEFNSKEEYLKKVCYEISLTLNSRAEPYRNIHELAKQFAEDSGLSPVEAAIDFGYPSFEQFVRSDYLKDYVLIGVDTNGDVLYMPQADERTKHIRDNQFISCHIASEKENKTESRKMAKAMLPENRASLMEGKRRLVDIVNELGGSQKPVAYQDVQNMYLQRFDVQLSPPELRRLFQRATISKILTSLMHDEFELFTAAERQGQIFMKLRATRDD